MRGQTPLTFRLAAAMIAMVFCGSGNPAWADPPHYTITDLGALPAPPQTDLKSPPKNAVIVDQSAAGQTVANAINDQGQIVGQSSGQAFVWQNGTMTGLGALPWDGASDDNTSQADAINPQGQVVGGSGSFGPVVMSGLYHCTAFLSSPGHLQALADHAASFEAFGINAHGEIVGLDSYRGFYWAHGKLISLDTLSHVPVGNRGSARAINAQGQIVGQSTINTGHKIRYPGQETVHGRLKASALFKMDYYHHAALWQHRGTRFVTHDLGTLKGYPNSEAAAINDKGWIVGNAETYPVGDTGQVKSQAFLWCHGRMTKLSTLPGASQSIAQSINDQGDIVGTCGDTVVLWQHGKIWDLNTLLPKDSGWTLQTATGINNHGWIIGNGKYQGKARGFLLMPFRHSSTPQAHETKGG